LEKYQVRIVNYSTGV